MTAPALILLAASLVQQQQGKPADEVRVIESKLASLNKEAKKLGPAGAPMLGTVAADPKKPAKLRLWMVVYLQTINDPASFSPLKAVLLDKTAPDAVRSQAARAVADAPVGALAKRRALCASLDPNLEAGRETLLETLFALSRLGCEEPSLLELRAFDTKLEPQGDEIKDVMLAVAALGKTRAPAALDSLDRLFAHFRAGSPQRKQILETLLSRVDEMGPERRSWTDRAMGMFDRETKFPANAEIALRLLAALGDPKPIDLAARLLKNKDGALVVGAAEILARHDRREYLEKLDALVLGFHQDERFSAAPHRDPAKLLERLEAAANKLR